jgi:hypothetical protein
LKPRADGRAGERPPPRVALLTLDGGAYVIDDDLAVAELRARGWGVEEIPWRRRGVDWRAFDLVVVRTTWDYQHDLDAFLDALAAIDATGVPLANPSALVRWNARKTYLRDLAARDVADAVMAALDAVPLQARVDLVRLDDGALALMELEAIEPSLYFRTHPRAAANFADAVARYAARGATKQG